MKHSKQIIPLESDPSSQTELPDRSDLSKLYGAQLSTKKKTTDEALAIKPTAPFMINRTVISLVLTALVAIVYLLVIYTYQSADADMKQPDPLYPLIRVSVTAVCVLAWIILFRILAKQFDDAGGRLSTFLVVYLFYLFPALELVYGSPLHNSLGIFFTIALWVIFNFSAVFYMTWAFNRQSTSHFRRLITLGIPVFLLVIFAILA